MHPWVGLDRRHLWRPYTALDDQHQREPLLIKEAQGCWLHDVNGRRYLDANGSWWVSTLGHRHPRLVSALKHQAEIMPHCAMAGILHEPGVRLAQELIAIAPPGMTRVFFSDDGSTAVEVAIKIAFQFWQQNNRPARTKFLSLGGAYHGDTLGAVSLGGIETFRARYGPLLFDVFRPPLEDTPEGWRSVFREMSRILQNEREQIAGVIVEPLIQGAAGMRIWQAEFLADLRKVCTEVDTWLIADEVFVGYGRTGTMWACGHAAVSPDILCTAKGFSGGVLPMAATLTTERIYEGFRGGIDRALMHGHSFYGNPLGAAVAREVLAIYRDENILERTSAKSAAIEQAFARFAQHPKVHHVRTLGMVAAFDLSSKGYRGTLGWKIYARALERGVYLRPLGDTVYITPALNIPAEDLEFLLNTIGDCLSDLD